MEQEKSSIAQLINVLLDPIPQYVTGCLPALLIIGESPMNSFTKKLAWMLICLGCPFVGLIFNLNIGSEPESRCIYWLQADFFTDVSGNSLNYRPFGVRSLTLSKNQKHKRTLMTYVDRCTAKASVLERLSSLLPAYYIIVGILAGISMVTESVVCDEWPFIPLLLSWTIPAILRRGIVGNLIVKDPNVEFKLQKVVMDQPNDDDRYHKRCTVALTALASIIYPWITVVLAYYSPPIGFFCRSKFITVICSIWTFNNLLGFLCHCYEGKNLFDLGKGMLRVLFFISGFIVAILLFVLSLLAKNNEWWVGLFGDSCGAPISEQIRDDHRFGSKVITPQDKQTRLITAPEDMTYT
ncbi:hypothetical protein GLOIN_2v1480417 [Rhizophagus irregularis DAOM 181602=DAOM 197198]|uniref:Uncharacterized protein n=1 Tax=Rhizophagus irregularis (strain DAOM 181602 / DAOM 197198 / MUCL 43194) TaxID=747089 RepID=A0A2P4PU37_RHIID|nr:hypothetical protein GLOIN_2v1480417 [Rhizophagus irregularis DAOM 181602=DAOM 197198]POG68902.1 hypothetical protein GLOIN_2v1480417 [Rhizophagus irregularis DAOM 181602=DAOM 197198]|eukprot:XP_025175768.1 hypothetical protein GLOIN_2v1480417 [Rhizophagus irregularis DAOM 181602=DAOM 197198]